MTASPARLHLGFWSIALAFLTAMAFSTVPTPLYPLYMKQDGFDTFTVTIVFAVYAVGVVISLLLAGHVSDRLGRKTILIPALALELLAAVLFLTSTSLPVLLAARFVTGLGVGMITATATAHLSELHAAHRPGASRQRFEVVSTAANSGGLGLGTLLAGLLAQFVYAPLRTPYLVFIGLLAVSIVAVALTPETVTRVPGRYAYRPQRIGAHGDRTVYLAAATSALASFAVFGVFTSLAPGFVAGTLHHSSRALAGAIVFAVFGAAAAAQALTGRLSGPAKTRLGLLAQAGGIVTLVAGMHTASLAAFLIGGVAAGIGAGVLFKAAVGAVAASAAPAERGEALAGLFLIAYLGLGVPAIGLGVATQSLPAVTVMTWFAGALLVLLGAVALLSRRGQTPAQPVAEVRELAHSAR
ncbi:MFS family permease [Actinoplanes lutulentus]|uniref:Putative MFS family arabinose efflux permease n=1 Tax=Actinoplanes lutulentus TaxID=1287878 RepID=A0A327YX91_9ACTN|nr:MFS transporter [Actinoplanes lutulentus]MBB2943158.1 MFS family permease [Actinoplanes lutulentus]RAK25547.1 putative MFS family arabinose efflux permease [Actinoplanes lutulentus]